MHVGDLDVLDRAGARTDRERRARIVSVDVHLESLLVTDDQERVSETLQVGLDAVGVELALDHERRAVPEARELLVRGLDRRLPCNQGGAGERLSADRGRDPAHELDEAGRPRIDDPGLAQDVELFLRAGNRFLAPCDEELEQLLHRSRTFGLGRLREDADGGQHRALDRLADCPVGGIGSRSQRPRDGLAVDRLCAATDDLREDHAGVPARTHQRGAARLARKNCPVLCGRRFQLVANRPGRQRKVRAGVAVRHRIDVEVVDPGSAPIERGDGPANEAEDSLSLAHANCSLAFGRFPITPSTSPLTRTAGRPGCGRPPRQRADR